MGCMGALGAKEGNVWSIGISKLSVGLSLSVFALTVDPEFRICSDREWVDSVKNLLQLQL